VDEVVRAAIPGGGPPLRQFWRMVILCGSGKSLLSWDSTCSGPKPAECEWRTRVRHRLKTALLGIAVFAPVLCGPWLSQKARAQGVSEYEVKAAFLLNFTMFVEWPPSAFATPDAPMTLCVLGGDPFGAILDEDVRGATVNGRRLVVRRLAQVPSPHTCQVVFVALSGRDLPTIVHSLEPDILTVGEGESFLRAGGTIAFVTDNRRVRFIVNVTAAAHEELRLSSRLLAVAKAVEK